jgi:hypothetical protein
MRLERGTEINTTTGKRERKGEVTVTKAVLLVPTERRTRASHFSSDFSWAEHDERTHTHTTRVVHGEKDKDEADKEIRETT